MRIGIRASEGTDGDEWQWGKRGALPLHGIKRPKDSDNLREQIISNNYYFSTLFFSDDIKCVDNIFLPHTSFFL